MCFLAQQGPDRCRFYSELNEKPAFNTGKKKDAGGLNLLSTGWIEHWANRWL